MTAKRTGMLAASVLCMPSFKKLSVGLVGAATLALVSLHSERADACSQACISVPTIADHKLLSPVVKMPTFVWGHMNTSAVPTLRRGDVDVPITTSNDGAFGLAIAAAEPLEPGEYSSDAPIVGTSTALEKDYFRLGGAPHPSTVRPLSALQVGAARGLKAWTLHFDSARR